MSTKHDRMMQRIENHGNELNAIFNTGLEPVALAKKLKRLETKQHKAATDYCNIAGYEVEYDKITKSTEKALIKLLGDKIPFYINSDPRGYALKIDDRIVQAMNLDIYRDFCGYGILAPDFSEE
jgi:hypothetical protein